MKRWMWAPWMLGGVVVGALAATIALGALHVPFAPGSSRLLQNLPTPVMARVLLAREAATISRADADGEGGATLFGRAEFVGGPLCRVRVYRFSDQAMTNEGVPVPSEVADMFGIWMDPLAAESSHAEAGRRGCKSYKDFAHLIWGRSEEIIPGIDLVDRARWSARRETADFVVSCLGRRNAGGRAACDGEAYLRSLDLKSVVEVRALGNPSWGPGARRQFWVHMDDGRLHGHPLMTTLTITSDETGHMRDARIVSVAIEQEAY